MTMVKARYLPRAGDERNQWLQNFAASLPQYAATLGVTNDRVLDMQQSAATLNYLQNTLAPYVRTFSKSVTTLLNDVDSDDAPSPVLLPQYAPPAPPTALGDSGIFERVVELVNTVITQSANYTPSIQTALGLDPIAPPVGSLPLIRTALAQPMAHVELSFTRGGSPLVIVEGQRNGGDWEMLDKVASSHFLDLRANAIAGQSESRSYRIRYSDGNAAIGDYSLVVSIATQA